MQSSLISSNIYFVSYKLALAMSACHLPVQGLNHVLCSCWCSTPPEGVQCGEQEWGTLCFGKTGRAGLQIVIQSQELILWAQYLYLFMSRKTQNSSWWRLFFITSIAHEMSRNFLQKKMCLNTCTPFLPNHIYTVLPLYLFRSVSHRYLRSDSQIAILILPQIKFNLQLSRCVFFFNW